MGVVFGKKWFEEKQKSLLFLLNNPLTKKMMRKILDIGFKERIINITPYEFIVDRGNNHFGLETHIARKFGIRLYTQLAPFWNLCHQFDTLFANKFFPAFNLGFDTLTVYPDADPESTSVDGKVLNTTMTVSEAGWTACRNATAGIDADTIGNATLLTHAYRSVVQGNISMTRSFFLFDTHLIPSLSTINSATLSIYGYQKFDLRDINHDVNIYASSPASNTNLVVGDWDQVQDTAFSTAIPVDSWQTEAYNAFALNTPGKANIAMGAGAVSKFSARNANFEVANSYPALDGGANPQSESIQAYFSEDTTAANGKDPKLFVDFSPPSTGYGKVIFISR